MPHARAQTRTDLHAQRTTYAYACAFTMHVDDMRLHLHTYICACIQYLLVQLRLCYKYIQVEVFNIV